MATNVRTDAKTHKLKFHAGWDLYAPPHTEVFAICDGRIVECREEVNATGKSTGYGKSVLLEFTYQDRTLYAFYAHLESWAFQPTDGKPVEITEGTRLGLTGTTGNANGEAPHLHFEIRTKRKVHHYPDGRISPGEVLGYVYENLDYRVPFTEAG